ncbi:Uncharacterised protein [Streptococcus sanguinis]|uniref:Uncharacterized protein n=1 Tax=Streptococcus sanguinis TaxID=1305 RepID=A0AAJ5NNF6_STRSA|nr:Uncharacterised protein [Streptococcus sanguinis]
MSIIRKVQMYLLLLFFSLNSVLPSQIVFAEQSQNGV